MLTTLTTDVSGYVYATGAFDNETDVSSREVGYLTLKLDPEGKVVWSRKQLFQTGWSADAKMFPRPRIAVDSQGNVLVLDVDYESAFVMLKYDETGNKLWGVAAPDHEIVRSSLWGFDLDADGNVYVAWEDPDNYWKDPDAYIVTKYDVDGHSLWTTQHAVAYGGVASSSLTAFAVRPNGEVFLNGFSRTGDEYLCTTIKLGPDGAERWRSVPDLEKYEAVPLILASAASMDLVCR